MSALSLVYTSSSSLRQRRDKALRNVPKCLPYVAVAVCNIIFGTGAPIGSFGQASMNPALFAMIRTGVAAPILMTLSYFSQKTCPSLTKDWKVFVIPGFCLFMGIFFWMIGIKLISSIEGSFWQVSCGAFALMYGYCMGVEHINIYKLLGVVISIGGALFMALYNNIDIALSFWDQFGGSICCFTNLTSMSFYFIFLKKWGVHKYSPITLTAYTYLFAFIFTSITTILFSFNDSIMALLCEDCTAWSIPSIDNYLSLMYYIVILSVMNYVVMIWSTQFLSPSTVLIFTVLQPLSSCALNQVLLSLGMLPLCEEGKNPNHGNICVYGLSMSDLGAIGIVLGLFLVIYGNEKAERKKSEPLNDCEMPTYYSINQEIQI